MKLTREHIENIVKEYLDDEEELPSDVSKFTDKFEKSNLDDYVEEKINDPEELFGLIEIILETVLKSESIDRNQIIKVLKDITEKLGEAQ